MQQTKLPGRITLPTRIPPNVKIVGQISDGRPILEREVEVFTKVPRLDANGNQIWRKDRLGEPITPVFRRKRSTKKERYVVHDMLNGNSIRIPADQLEVANTGIRERKQAEREFADKLAAAAVARGLTPEAVLDALMKSEETETFPKYIGGGLWDLSDGSRFKGKKPDALKAEAALQPDDAA